MNRLDRIFGYRTLPAEWTIILDRCADLNSAGRRPRPHALLEGIDQQDKSPLWRAYREMVEHGILIKFGGIGCLIDRHALKSYLETDLLNAGNQ